MKPILRAVTKGAEGLAHTSTLWYDDQSRPRVSGPRGDLWIVVLAGGEGTRLQSFTQQVLGTERPKQFCRIIGTPKPCWSWRPEAFPGATGAIRIASCIRCAASTAAQSGC